MCAHLAGLPIEPCFRVQKIDYRRFRGSVSGLGFAYCDFYQRNPRAQLISDQVMPGEFNHRRGEVATDRRVVVRSSSGKAANGLPNR